MNQTPIATYSMCGEFGINIFEIDDYSESVFWNWSNESGESRESSIQYDEGGNGYFMAGTETQVFLYDCIKTTV